MTIEPTNVSEGLTMAKFEREERYVVMKIKHLGEVKAALLRDFLDGLDAHPIECVVVEHDWPEYEPVWGMIRQRCEAATLSPPLPSPGVERLREALVRIEAGLRNLIARGKSPEVLKAGMSIAADEVAALSALPLDGGLK